MVKNGNTEETAKSKGNIISEIFDKNEEKCYYYYMTARMGVLIKYSQGRYHIMKRTRIVALVLVLMMAVGLFAPATYADKRSTTDTTSISTSKAKKMKTVTPKTLKKVIGNQLPLFEIAWKAKGFKSFTVRFTNDKGVSVTQKMTKALFWNTSLKKLGVTVGKVNKKGLRNFSYGGNTIKVKPSAFFTNEEAFVNCLTDLGLYDTKISFQDPKDGKMVFRTIGN